MLKRVFTIIASLLVGAVCLAQPFVQTEDLISWKITSENVDGNTYRIKFTGKLADGWHTYPLESQNYPTEVSIEEVSGGMLSGVLYTLTEPTEFKGEPVFFDQIVIAQDIILEGESADVKGTITWMLCADETCTSPDFYDFTITVSDPLAVAADELGATKNGKGFNWGLVLEALLWGFAALLTPCVFPMVPMTVSFFIKGSENPVAGRFRASMYGLFIVLLYTVPISLIIFITWIVGGDAVTADIFNWLATHWIPNLLFFIIFMVFAASFFGAFEITLPSSLVNKSDKGSDRGGLIGVFFMALTLVLVSFSCTGPIVGSVLIKATQGEFWEPMVAMLVFSVAFALPFTILAFFPSLLKNIPKSGGWLNSVKVILGFVEVALGFKFLSVADQTYHWGILDREVALAIWIVVFTLLGLYLLGKIRFVHDDKVEHVSVLRLALAIGVFSFVVYMIPGMWGAPLKALSGYLPPITTQDFVLGQPTQTIQTATPSNGETYTLSTDSKSDKYDLHLPLGLQGYFTLEEGFEAAKLAGKPVFVDITGHGCVNCREMESRVWSDPKVLSILQNDYIIVALYTDDKQKVDEEDWITNEKGDVLKTLGRINSYIARTRFGVNAQPNYILLSPEGKQLAPIRGYNLDVDEFVAFLRSGLAN